MVSFCSVRPSKNSSLRNRLAGSHKLKRARWVEKWFGQPIKHGFPEDWLGPSCPCLDLLPDASSLGVAKSARDDIVSITQILNVQSCRGEGANKN